MSNTEVGKLELAFWQFHNDNPHVYELLVKFAREWRQFHSHCAVTLLFQRLRWAYAVETHGDPNFKLNNNHQAFYARLIMEQEPDLKDIFRLRQQRVQSTFGPLNETLPSGEHVA